MADFNLPADTIAVVPLRHSDEAGQPVEPSADWELHSSDTAVTAELSEDGRSVRLVPNGEVGARADITMARGDVGDALHVVITAPRVTRIAFDVANATMEPRDNRVAPAPEGFSDHPVPEPVPEPAPASTQI